MLSVLNGPILGTSGVGKFHQQIGIAGRTAITVLNVVGWIPGASIISGAIRNVVGVFILSKSGSSNKVLGKVWIARGVSEMCCVGILLAPIDIGCSAARSIKRQKGAY